MTRWFTESPVTIANEQMGFNLDLAKIKNLVSLAGGDLGLWYYLGLMPQEFRKEHGDEWANFILGPLAAALKANNVGFEARNRIVPPGILLMWFEAMAAGNVPKSMRKPLYDAMTRNFVGASPDEASARSAMTALIDSLKLPEADSDEVKAIVVKVLTENPTQASQAKEDPKLVGWIMGQVMRASTTKLDPNFVRGIILESL